MRCTQLVCHVLVHNLASFPSLPALLVVVTLYILPHVGQCNKWKGPSRVPSLFTPDVDVIV